MRAVRVLHNVSEGNAQKGEDDGERVRPQSDVALDASWEKSKIKIYISKKINRSNNKIDGGFGRLCI